MSLKSITAFLKSIPWQAYCRFSLGLGGLFGGMSLFLLGSFLVKEMAATVDKTGIIFYRNFLINTFLPNADIFIPALGAIALFAGILIFIGKWVNFGIFLMILICFHFFAWEWPALGAYKGFVFAVLALVVLFSKKSRAYPIEEIIRQLR